jgi:hypothetical protein
VTHDELMVDLAKHLAGDNRLVWMDMQIGPAGSPRPDVFTLQKSYTRPSPSAYECKISVPDFRSDVTSGKWQKYLRFAGAVTFCVPAGLVKKEDVPVGCGFMTRGAEGWATLRRATRQTVKWDADVMLKLFIDGYGRELGQVELKRRDMRTAIASNKLAKKFGQHVAEVIRDLEQAKRMVEYYTQAGHKRIEAARKEAGQITEAQQARWVDISKVLGLPETANRWDIDRAIANLTKPDKSDQVDLLKRSLQSIRDQAERSIQSCP